MGSSSAGSSGSSGAGTGVPMPTLPRSRSKKGSSGRKPLWKRLLKKGSNSSAAEGDGRGDGSRDGLPPLQHQPQQQQRQLHPPATSSSSSADFSPLFEAAFETADLAAITSVSEAPPSPRGPQDDDPAASPRPSPRDSFRDSSRGRGGSARRSGGRPPAVVSPSPSSSPGGGGSEARTSATPKLGPPPSSSNPCTPSSAGRSATPTGAGRSRTANPAHPIAHPSATSGPGHSSWGGGTIVSECHTKETKNTKANTLAGTATTASMTTFAKSASRDGEPPTGGASGTGASGNQGGGGGSGNRMWGSDWKWAGGFVESHAVTETTPSTTPSTGASGELGIPEGGGGRWAPWIDADDPAGAGPAGHPAVVSPAVADLDSKAALRPEPGPAPVASPQAQVGSGDRVPSPMISVEEGDDADADDENGPSMAVVVEEVTRVVDVDGGGRSSGAPKPQGLPPPRPSPSMFSGSKDSAEGRTKSVAGRGRFVGRGSVPSLKKRPKGGTSPPVSMGSGGGSSTGGMPRGLNAVAKTAAKGYAKGGALKASREGSPGSGTGMGRPGQGPGTNNKDGIDREDQPGDPNAIAQEGGAKGCEDLKDQTFFDSLRHDQGGDGAAAAAPSPAPKSGPKDVPWESDARNLNTTDDAIAAPNAKITVDAPRGGIPHKAAAAGGGREADLSSEEPHLYAEINIPTSKLPYRRQGSGSRRHPKADKTSPYKFTSAAEAPLSKRQSSARSQGTADVSLAMTDVSDLTGRSSMFGSPHARGGPYGPDGGLDLVAAVARCGVAGAGAALVGPPALEAGAGAGGGDDPYARHEEENYFEYGGDEKLYMKPENRGGLGVVRESGEGSSPTDSAGEGGGGEDDGIVSRLLGVWNEAFGSTCRCFDGPGSPGAGPGEGGGEQPPWGASTVAGTAGGGAKSLGWSAGAGTVMETVNDTAATIAGLSKALSSRDSKAVGGKGKRTAFGKADAGEEGGPMFSDPMD